jgi:hypothetical protein
VAPNPIWQEPRTESLGLATAILRTSVNREFQIETVTTIPNPSSSNQNGTTLLVQTWR